MVHTVEPLLEYAQFDQAHFALWVALGIVVILLAIYFKNKVAPKNFR